MTPPMCKLGDVTLIVLVGHNLISVLTLEIETHGMSTKMPATLQKQGKVHQKLSKEFPTSGAMAFSSHADYNITISAI